jgi:hypothetical protein
MSLPENRFADLFFDPEPTHRRLARQLYADAADLPIVSPHGHVDPWLFVDEETRFGTLPSCSSSPTTTFTACSTRRVYRWRR